MAKQKDDQHLKDLLLDTLAQFYQDVIKQEMASKDDLKGFATKKDLDKFATKDDLKGFATKKDLDKFATKEDLQEIASRLEGLAGKDDLKSFATKDDLDELEARLMREIQENSRLITNIEVSVLGKLKNHETRIKVLEKFRSRFAPA